jgi:hypothetical protein
LGTREEATRGKYSAGGTGGRWTQKGCEVTDLFLAPLALLLLSLAFLLLFLLSPAPDVLVERRVRESVS